VTVIKTAAVPVPAATVIQEEIRQPAADEGKVTVRLPASAKLFVDGKEANLKNRGSRSFFTPKLEPNQDYFYTVKAEMTRNGQTVSESKRVVVRGGQVSAVDFGDMSNTVARSVTPTSAPARITVKLPADARLFVDDVACNLTSGTRSFDTPKLEPGREYSYVLKAEVERDGKMRTDTRRVVFQAGKEVSVDFGKLDGVTTASR
jgi:uncharacterized protein (TIGR03000 family)